MTKIRNLLTSGSRVILVGLFATVLAQTSTIQAMAADSGSTKSEPQASDIKQESDKDTQGRGESPGVPPGPDDCFKDKGCMTQTVTTTSGQRSTTGTTCRSGVACTTPGASCALGGTMRCKTIDLGGQNCTCACIKS